MPMHLAHPTVKRQDVFDSDLNVQGDHEEVLISVDKELLAKNILPFDGWRDR